MKELNQIGQVLGVGRMASNSCGGGRTACQERLLEGGRTWAGS